MSTNPNRTNDLLSLETGTPPPSPEIPAADSGASALTGAAGLLNAWGSLHVIIHLDGAHSIESHDGRLVADRVAPELAHVLASALMVRHAAERILAELDGPDRPYRRGC